MIIFFQLYSDFYFSIYWKI